MIYSRSALLLVDTSTLTGRSTSAPTWPHGRKDPGEAPAPISRKTEGPARHQQEKEPRHMNGKSSWAPSARPADFSMESPGGRKEDGNKISRPGWTREQETRLFSEIWQEGSAAPATLYKRKRPREEPREKPWTLPEIIRNGKQERGKEPGARLHLPYI